MKPADLEVYAKAFKVSSSWLAFGDGIPKRTRIPIAGQVLPNAKVEKIWPDKSLKVGDRDLQHNHIIVPDLVGDDYLGFIVNCDDFGPLVRPMDFIITRRGTLNPGYWHTASIGVVGLLGGHIVVRRCEWTGHSDYFNLHLPGLPPMIDVSVRWIRKIDTIVKNWSFDGPETPALLRPGNEPYLPAETQNDW